MSDILLREDLPTTEPWQLKEMHGDASTRGSGPRISAGKKPQSAAELEALQQQAWDESYAKGLEAGRAAGEAEFRAKGARLEQLFHALANPLEDVDAEVEEELTELSLAVARQVLRRELTVNPEHVIVAVRDALGQLPASARDIRVALNPDDAELVRAALPEPTGHARWEIDEDPVIARGGCMVRSPLTTVDATLEARVQAVAARVLGTGREDDRETAAHSTDVTP